MTSFGEFATVAAFGSSYIRHPSQWVKGIDKLTNDSIVLYQPNKVQSFRYLKGLWKQPQNGTAAVLQWFWNGAIPTDGNYCGFDVYHDSKNNSSQIICDAAIL